MAEEKQGAQPKRTLDWFSVAIGAGLMFLIGALFLPGAIDRYYIRMHSQPVDYQYVLHETGADGVWRVEEFEGRSNIELYDSELEGITRYYCDAQHIPRAILGGKNSPDGFKWNQQQAKCVQCKQDLHLYFEPLKDTDYLECPKCKSIKILLSGEQDTQVKPTAHVAINR